MQYGDFITTDDWHEADGRTDGRTGANAVLAWRREVGLKDTRQIAVEDGPLFLNK